MNGSTGPRPRRMQRPPVLRRILAAAGAAFLMVLPAVLTGVGPSIGPLWSDDAATGDATAAATHTAGQDLGQILERLSGPLFPHATLGPAADWLVGAGALDPEGGFPADASRLLAGAHGHTPWDPVPVPEAPPGPEPLLSALRMHADVTGVHLPAEDVLRAQVAALRLAPAAEQALARLVLAHGEAVRLEADAVRLLSPTERRLVDGDPGVVADWLAEEPGRGDAEHRAKVRDLLGRIDISQRLRAADLLLRTVEQVKDPLALPPAPAAGGDPGEARAFTGEADRSAATDAAERRERGDPVWGRLYALLAPDAGTDPTARPHESLGPALTNLAAVLGHPAGSLPLGTVEDALPASLADAVATIVTARRVGLESGDATLHSLLLMEATQEALPTLKAWAALLDLDAGALSTSPEALRLVETALSPHPSPSRLLAHSGGSVSPPGTTPAPPDLATLLRVEGMAGADAVAAARSLPPPVALGAAHVLHGMQRLDTAREHVLQDLDPAHRDVLREHTSTVTALLEAPSWTPDEAVLVEAWARGVAQVGPDGLRALRQAQGDAVAAVEAGVDVLRAYVAATEHAPLPLPPADGGDPAAGGQAGTVTRETSDGAEDPSPWYRRALSYLADFRIIGTASAQVAPPPPACTGPGGGPGDCDEDVWLLVEAPGRTLLVTGFGKTTVGPGLTSGNPDLVIDLGGDDTYLHPVGAADGLATARVAIDLGGDDEYPSLPSRLAHGAADGLGSLGVLWDRDGDDRYEHECAGDGCGTAGYGANGAVGILVDGAGNDTYHAPGSRGHGAGWDQGIGLLLDHGPGSDAFTAERGQGHGHGDSGLGLLLNDGTGANRYGTTAGNPRFQGGHQDGSTAAGLLIDLGGAGTFYSNLDLPDEAVYHSFDPDARSRSDDSFWVEATTSGGLGVGLDSTPDDEDEDNFTNLVELVAGSDPEDPDSTPGLGIVGSLLDLLEGLVPDPGDPTAVLGALEGVLWRDSLLCEEPSLEASDCTALLHVGGITGDNVTGPAHVLIELGGDDTYTAEVAGPGDFWAPKPEATQTCPNCPIVGEITGKGPDAFNVTADNVKYPGVGSYALDLGGDDTYLTPEDGGPTQGAVSVFNLPSSDTTDEIDEIARPTHHLTHASLLLDVSGDDRYEASEGSQGAASVTEGTCVGMNNPGEAWLIDIDGEDTYIAGDRSQGYVEDLAGRAGLIDLRGNDNYSFMRQATADTPGDPTDFTGTDNGICFSARDIQPLALLLDAGGRDTYTSQIPITGAGLDPTDWEVFSTQGVGPLPGDILGVANNNLAEYGRGVFIDEGSDHDTYRLATAVGGYTDVSDRKNNETRHQGNNQGTISGGGEGARRIFFSDGFLAQSVGDDHEDRDGDGAPNLLEDVLGTDRSDRDDHPGTVWGAGPGGVDMEGPLLRIPGHLAIGGHGDTVYNEPYAFIVALGGDNVYNGTAIGGNTEAGSVTLLLDAGSGATAYLPDGGCASLGGATSGVAILADGGGRNTFRTVLAEEELGECGPAATQGAATNNAVGVLVTWDAENRFEANASGGGPLLAQGAASGGLGLLAALGSGDGTFLAPNGTAQGYAEAGGTGLLWSGTGDDRYEAGDRSQGASQGGTGLLYDPGGNDEYRLRTPPSDPTFGQGAASGVGAGLLLDLAGDDRYIAIDSTQVQGAGAGGGSGLVVDAGGHDLYHAGNRSQAHASGDGSVGVLLELQGRDSYRLDGDSGLGASDGGCALFIDAAGWDRHPEGGDARNDHTWTESGGCTRGIDVDRFDEVFDALQRLNTPVGLRDVDLEVRSGGTVLKDGAVVSGDLHLRALVDLTPPDPDRVHRIAFLDNNKVVGHGTYQGVLDGGRLVYDLTWRTTSSGFPESHPDGNHSVLASVFLDAGTDGAGAGRPDLPAMDSPPLDIRIDNPPLVVGEMDRTRVSPTLGQTVRLDVTLGRDLDWPDDEGVPADACEDVPDGECHPGGHLRLRITPVDGSETVFANDTYRRAGTHVFNLTATEGGTWPDGVYRVVASATDAAGRTRGDRLPDLRVDGAQPSSWITTPTSAGLAHRNESGALRLAWNHSDGDGSGVREVCVLEFVDDAGTPGGSVAGVECFGPETTHRNITGVGTDDILHFTTIAIDATGNPESPCQDGEAPNGTTPLGDDVCHLAKTSSDPDNVTTVTVDFDLPTVGAVDVLVDGAPLGEAFYRPGTPINFTAGVTDVGTGVAEVEVRLPGDHVGTMSQADDGTWYYDAWGDANTELSLEGEEEDFTVVARDAAANEDEHKGALSIDGLPPRVTPRTTTYYSNQSDPQGSSMAVGEPESFAVLEAVVRDFDDNDPTTDFPVETVIVNASALGLEDPFVPCAPQGAPFWTCDPIRIPKNTTDGDYRLVFIANDTVGNSNATESVLVEVRNQTLALENVTVASVGHDRFRVEWKTDFEGTSTVLYGLTPEPNSTAGPGPEGGHRTDHAVEVTGLAPSQEYYYQVVSVGRNGLGNSTNATTVTTLNAFTFDLTTPSAGQAVGGKVEMAYHLESLDGSDPVQATLLVQDAEGVESPFEVETFSIPPGPGNRTLDTRRFADGEYLLLFDLSRPGDRTRNESAPFFIDNTAPVVAPVSPRPGSTVGETHPAFEAVLLDPLGREPPINDTLRVTVDGGEVGVQLRSDEAVDSVQRRIGFSLLDNLSHGDHNLTVEVSDRAGNVGSENWTLRVDLLHPRVEGAVGTAPDPGPDLARPGGQVHVDAQIRDGSRVTSAWIDRTPLGLYGAVSMLAVGNDRWEADMDVPRDAPHGTFRLPIVATDEAGNEGVAGHVNVTIDAHPPRIMDASVQEVGYTWATFLVTTDEPTRGWTDDGEAPPTEEWKTRHEIQVDGLAPGRDHIVPLHVSDRAGHVVESPVQASTPADLDPPSAVKDLQASSPDEGLVVLAWSPATDNAGIDHYRLERGEAPRAEALDARLAHDAVAFQDDQAPAGRTVTYRVTPVDVAGHAGATTGLDVDILARPHLSNATVTPLRGSSDEPFTFRVEYRHAGDRGADGLTVHVGSSVHPFTRVPGGDPCRDGCMYEARVLLPASSLFGPTGKAQIRATTDGQTATLAVPETPFVLRGDGGAFDLSEGERTTPATGGLPAVAALTFLAFLLRRRRPLP